ncbi:hypothetical protein J7L05_08615, partial [bacterium]|nr:hypothetical protein [bacterium]
PTKQGIDGNMSTKQMVLDYKYTGGTYGYGESSVGGGQAVMNVLVIDKKPWGGLYPGFMPDDLELIEWLDNDWNSTLLISQEEYNPDPKKRYYKHDWTGEEIAIKWWNLTTILQTSEKEIQGIKVRITDNTQDPVDGYHGNWRRSDNILDTLHFTGSNAKGRFIADNPYDDVDSFKIVKFDGQNISNIDKETTFIYRRAKDGPDAGQVILDYYILVEENDNNPDPFWIDVKFSSTESKYPDGCATDVTLRANQLEGDDLPGEPGRLTELFEPQSECPKYYHTYVTISDNKLTSAQNHILYVSSRDGELVGEDKMDYASSISNEFISRPHQVTECKFGSSRGSGRNEPAKDLGAKHWYSYDEFITNGGFEIVEAEIVTQGVIKPLEDKEYVPVQSEADIMLIEADGEYDNNGEPTTGEDYFTMLTFSYPENIYVNKPAKWIDNADEFTVNNIDEDFCVGNQFCSDFSSEPDAGWGNFWFNTSGELRWLALDACYSMKVISPDVIRLNWKNIIDANYVSSVCGFTDYVYGTPVFFGRYGDYLTGLYTQVGGYESEDEVCLPGHEIYYFGYDPNDPDSWKANASKDLSVAAWMEAAASGFYDEHQNLWADCTIWSAAAIDDDYYYELVMVDENGEIIEEPGDHKGLHQIQRTLFN